jgi:hypothetical protein
MSGTCAMFSPECHGRLEWHHAIKQQRLKRTFPHGARWAQQGLASRWVPADRYGPVSRYGIGARTLDDILGDTRNRVFLCTRHHELVTNGRLKVELPPSVWRFAEEFGLTAQLENDIRRAA